MFEGFRPAAYLDTLGVWTIGFGSTIWAGERVTADTPAVTKVAALVEVRSDLLEAIAGCQALYAGRFDILHGVEQEVLIHMGFQLGIRKLSRFLRMREAVMIGDVDGWVMEMKDSRWWHQTPRPARALAEAIANTDWQGQWVMG